MSFETIEINMAAVSAKRSIDIHDPVEVFMEYTQMDDKGEVAKT